MFGRKARLIRSLTGQVASIRESRDHWLDACRDSNKAWRHAEADADRYAAALAKLIRSTEADNLRRLRNLIRWLAWPFADNDPNFAAYDPWTGQARPRNQELEETWREVVRGSEVAWEDPESDPVETGAEETPPAHS